MSGNGYVIVSGWRGVIFDTNSCGRFDLLLYEDGVLAVKGNYVRSALLAGGTGIGGAAAAAAGRRGYNRRRLDKLAERSRADLISDHPANRFMPSKELTRLVLEKHWYAHSLTIDTITEPDGRKYSWKPALNNFDYVRQTVVATFGAGFVAADP